MTQNQEQTMISKVRRVGKKLFAYEGEFAGEEPAEIDFKDDLQEPDAKKTLKRSPSTELGKSIYTVDNLLESQIHITQLDANEEEKQSPEFPENATEEEKRIIRNKKRNEDQNGGWLTMIREYASSLSQAKLSKMKVDDYNHFEDEQDEADADDYLMDYDQNYIDIFTQNVDADFFKQWQPLQVRQIITDP